jgi:Lrp/AsnC family leucine-responsive transcriptional regulator
MNGEQAKEKSAPALPQTQGAGDLPALDAADLRLLALLQQDASLSNHALAQAAHLSAATCHRRVRRLVESGVIESRVAVLSPARLAQALGQESLSAIVEVTLDVQSAERLAAFEARAAAHPLVQQCWRVAAAVDFVLVVQAPGMAAYQDVVRVLLSEDANVRNVRAMFATHRAKFTTGIALEAARPPAAAPGSGPRA